MEADRKSTPLAAACMMGACHQRIHLLQDRSRGSYEVAACRCRSYTAARSLEYNHANRVFQLADRTAERRLPKQQRFGGPSKAAMFHRRHSVSQMLQVHS